MTPLHHVERGSGPPVLLVHGSGDHSALFGPLVELLAPRFRTIAYDRRGFAGSAGSVARGLRQHVDDAAGLLRELQAVPATVVGSSAGGVVALALAAQHPDLVASLVVAEPTYQPALAATAGSLAALGRVYARWLLRRDTPGAAELLYRWVTTDRTGGNQYDRLPEPWRRTGVGHARAALREVTQLLRPWPSRRAVASIPCPVTLLVGDRGERLFRRTSDRVRRARAAAGIQVVPIARAAHLLATDRPDAVADAVARAAEQAR